MRFFGVSFCFSFSFSLRSPRPRAATRSALAVGIGLCGSVVFLFDCGGSAFTSASGGGAGGAADGGSGGTAVVGGSNGASAGQVGRGGTSSAGAASGGTSAGSTSVGGTSAGGASAGGNPPTAGTGGVIVAGAAGMSAGGTGGMPSSVCPATPPTNGACVSGLSCTYGTDLRSGCRTHFMCASGRWTASGNACSTLLDCGARDGGVPQVGKACTDVGEDCTLNGGTSTGLIYCRCDQHLNPVSTVWDCQGPPQKPCPQLLPNEGQPCDGSATDSCLYGSCSTQAAHFADMQCVNHVWVNEPAVCAN